MVPPLFWKRQVSVNYLGLYVNIVFFPPHPCRWRAAIVSVNIIFSACQPVDWSFESTRHIINQSSLFCFSASSPRSFYLIPNLLLVLSSPALSVSRKHSSRIAGAKALLRSLSHFLDFFPNHRYRFSILMTQNLNCRPNDTDRSPVFPNIRLEGAASFPHDCKCMCN